MNFLVLLTISAAAAVTVYRNEDNMAMETQPRRTREPDQQAAPLTIYPKKERAVYEDQQRASFTVVPRPAKEETRGSFYPRQKSEDGQRGVYYGKQKQEAKAPPKKYIPKQEQQFVPKQEQQFVPNHEQQYFENFHEAGNNGHKMGYSSYVQHHDDTDVTGQGSSDIKKTVPKSSVQVEMFHGPEQVTKKPVAKEVPHGKLKNKPRIYQDTLNNYKKAKNSFPGASGNPILVKDLPTTTTTPVLKYFTPSQPKFQPNHSKRRPYSKRYEVDTLYQAAEQSPTKSESAPTSHSESNSNYSEQLSQRYLKYGPPADAATTEKSAVIKHIHEQTESPLYEIRGSKWTALSDSVEIATSEEAKPKSKRSRRPKEINSGLTSYGHFYNSEPHHFDHDKALRSSTSFGVSNVMFGGDLSDENVKQTILEGGSAFNIAHSYDIAKAVEAQKIGASQGPVQFGTELGVKRIPKHNMVNAGGFEIPVMTEEEFERHFGKYRTEPKKPFRPVQRVPFDARPKQLAQSFAQFNGNPWAAQSQHVPVVKSSPNVDMFPSLSYLLPSRRNVSLVPERHGRVLSDDSHNEPQQFSVSASYQIDRNHGSY